MHRRVSGTSCAIWISKSPYWLYLEGNLPQQQSTCNNFILLNCDHVAECDAFLFMVLPTVKSSVCVISSVHFCVKLQLKTVWQWCRTPTAVLTCTRAPQLLHAGLLFSVSFPVSTVDPENKRCLCRVTFAPFYRFLLNVTDVSQIRLIQTWFSVMSDMF